MFATSFGRLHDVVVLKPLKHYELKIQIFKNLIYSTSDLEQKFV